MCTKAQAVDVRARSIGAVEQAIPSAEHMLSFDLVADQSRAARGAGWQTRLPPLCFANTGLTQFARLDLFVG
jgi:hypothetical protein